MEHPSAVVAVGIGASSAVAVAYRSATISMVTAASIVAPAVEVGSYSAPLVGLIVIAIASGATAFSHVNDSGFWVVSRYLGISEKHTLRSWTVMVTIIGLVDFSTAPLLSLFL